jgi:polysaccharide biosynthesis protein PslE
MTRDAQKELTRAALPATPRDLLALLLYHRAAIVRTFCGLAVAVFACLVLRVPTYEARMSILVKRERVDPVVTTEDAPLPRVNQALAEQDLNSEVELLRSQDLIEKVIVATGLLERSRPSIVNRLRERLAEPGSPLAARRLAAAVVDFRERFTVEPVRKTTLIRVAYKSGDATLAARVLSKLADFYLEKHLALHRPSGVLDFFDQETDRYRIALAAARARAADYTAEKGVVSTAMEKEIAVKQAGALEAEAQKIEIQIAETRQRARALEEQMAATPERITTERRDAQARLMETQQSTLLSLELKRIELQRNFHPTYPPLMEVEQQIAKTQASIEAAKASPIVEAVTNRDPTFDHLALALATARTGLSGLEANLAATREALARQRREARRLEQVEIFQADVDRDLKLAEQNYTSYVKKREETRISNALDLRRIVNVGIAEAPTVPVLPIGMRRLTILLGGLLLAFAASIAVALVLDYFDTSFRTADEVQAFLGIPVLATLPLKEKSAWNGRRAEPSNGLNVTAITR